MTHFLPELSVVIYAIACTVLALTVRRARLMKFDWSAPGMSQSSGTYREVREDNSLAENTSNVANTVLDNTTPGLAAALLVLFVGLLAALAGVSFFPALFGAMQEITTLNIVGLLVGGLALGYTFARLTVTLLWMALSLAFIAAGLAILAFAILFGVSFLTGNPYLQSAGVFVTDTADRWKKSTNNIPNTAVGVRSSYNLCAVITSLNKVGDIEATRDICGSELRKIKTKQRGESPAVVPSTKAADDEFLQRTNG